jgi:hypothetical protein
VLVCEPGIYVPGFLVVPLCGWGSGVPAACCDVPRLVKRATLCRTILLASTQSLSSLIIPTGVLRTQLLFFVLTSRGGLSVPLGRTDHWDAGRGYGSGWVSSSSLRFFLGTLRITTPTEKRKLSCFFLGNVGN